MKKRFMVPGLVIVFIALLHLSGSITFPPSLMHADANSKQSDRLPIFDTHVHYKEPAWEVYPPSAIIRLLKKTGVVKALVSSTPDEGTRMLYKEDPERIIPFLRPYHGDVNSSNWYQSDSILAYLAKRLEKPIYKGLGEFHIHAPLDAKSPVIQKNSGLGNKAGFVYPCAYGSSSGRSHFFI